MACYYVSYKDGLDGVPGYRPTNKQPSGSGGTFLEGPAPFLQLIITGVGQHLAVHTSLKFVWRRIELRLGSIPPAPVLELYQDKKTARQEQSNGRFASQLDGGDYVQQGG